MHLDIFIYLTLFLIILKLISFSINYKFKTINIKYLKACASIISRVPNVKIVKTLYFSRQTTSPIELLCSTIDGKWFKAIIKYDTTEILELYSLNYNEVAKLMNKI